MANPTAKLFEDAMVDNWEEVKRACEGSPELLIAKVDKSNNTILHVAVLKENKEVVEDLVNLIEEIYPAKGDDREKVLDALLEREKFLGTKNDNGNTPLHLAAAYGFEEICAALAKTCPYVIGCTNKDGETPYFLSARRGRKDVFLLLDQICKDHIPEALEFVFRKADGNTILHAAINGEFFELAHIIVQNYKDRKDKDLINARDERGRVPLHILAEKPHAFESGNRPGIYDWILYQCVIVTLPDKSDTKDAETQKNYPPNYETCVEIINIIKKRLKLLSSNPNGKDGKNDIENPPKIGSSPSERQGKPENPKPEPDQSGSSPSGGQGKPENDELERDQSAADQSNGGIYYYPPNYETSVHLLKFMVKLLIVVFGFGIPKVSKIAEKKKQHYWANLVAKELILADTTYQSQADGRNPETSRPEELIFGDDDDLTEKFVADGISPEEETSTPKPPDIEYETILENMWVAMQTRPISVEDLKKGLMDLMTKIRQDVSKFFAQYQITAQEVDAPSNKNPTRLTLEKRDAESGSVTETPFLVAARTGITEIVKGLLTKYPTAIHDMDAKEKNAALLAVEHRQTNVFDLFHTDQNITPRKILLQQVDADGNTALHLAATSGDHHPRTPGVAFRMQWEMKWFKFVKKQMPTEYGSRRNKKGQTPREVLISTHQELVTKAGDWMTKTSESCSVVAALIATVAFATSVTIPGGVNQDTGEPTLKNHTLFHVFAISSLVALCSSVTAMVLFLIILTSRFQESDFEKRLPKRLLGGLTTLFLSIAAILVSFCSGHFFLVQESVKSLAYPIYAATCLPITYFGLAQIPLYFDLLVSTFRSKPQASYKH